MLVVPGTFHHTGQSLLQLIVEKVFWCLHTDMFYFVYLFSSHFCDVPAYIFRIWPYTNIFPFFFFFNENPTECFYSPFMFNC